MVLELAVASSDPAGARGLARALGGRLYVDERDSEDLPFRALATVVTDDLEAAARVADFGLYLVGRRTMKEGTCAVASLSPMCRRPSLSHQQADAHWRDVHTPLALRHHAAMTSYTQLSVLHCFAGTALDGFALCAFASLEDLRERFFSEPDSRRIISEDIRKFADGRRSPRRLIVTEASFARDQRQP